MSTHRDIHELDVVELTVAVGRWPAGTLATVLEMFPEGALLEVADEAGETLGLPSVPWDALKLVPSAEQQRLAI